jgi:hypothetical protein
MAKIDTQIKTKLTELDEAIKARDWELVEVIEHEINRVLHDKTHKILSKLDQLDNIESKLFKLEQLLEKLTKPFWKR